MLMRKTHPEFQLNHTLPYGALVHEDGVQFVVFSRSASAMRLLLYERVEDRDPYEVIAFDRDTDRWGDVWSLYLRNLEPGQLYHLQADGPWDPARGQVFNGQARLIDPYAKALAGCFQPPGPDGVLRPPKCVVVKDDFNWEDDRHLRRKLSETVIYEMHVRGFTRGGSSGVDRPGTYLGVIEKIPYLQKLGVTAVELMPVHEFPICGFDGQRLERPNYWGYDPLAFFAPHRGYASDPTPGAQVAEFKEMVKALHQAGIEVILDVVFNHTAEGNELGPTLSFKGLENRVYYMLDNGGGRYRNFSGCGNTINGNHPIVREMIFHCLRYWVHNFHVDGFRFDLASILSRDRNGNLVPNPPVVETIAEDPMLADTKIIAEAWDAAGAYQVGCFGDLRWAEWNGRYRDDVRRFWRGDRGLTGAMATRMSGSSDLYEANGRAPYSSINFITSHDGFTLSDLVTYREKHNELNGECNRDGDNNNHSDNYGFEGPAPHRPEIERLRLRQIKNMIATLMLSQGVPMLVMGDECRRTQIGNNNPYCQDNDVSWFDWRLVEQNRELFRFAQTLIAFRRAQPTIRREHFLTGQPIEPGGPPDISWYSSLGTAIDWGCQDQTLTCFLKAPAREHDPRGEGRDVLIMLNATGAPREYILPPIAKPTAWRTFINTAATTPRDAFPNLDGPPPEPTGRVTLDHHALLCFVSPKRS